jgi:hypothetical protein
MASQSEIADSIQQASAKLAAQTYVEPPDDTPILPPNLLRQHDVVKAGCENALRSYETTVASATVAAKAFLTSLTEYKVKVKTMAFENTDLRKTYYLDTQMETVDSWNTYLDLVLVTLWLLYCKHMFYDLKRYKDPKAWAGLVAVVAAPFLLVWALKRFLKLPRPVTVYSTWAQPQQEWHGEN